MIEGFKNLSPDNWIAIAAIVVSVIVATIVGLFKLFSKKTVSPAQQKTIHQEGSGQTAGNIEGNNNIIAGGDVNTGIEHDNVLDRYERTLKQLGQFEEKIKSREDTINQLKEQLSQYNKTSDEKPDVPTELIQKKSNTEQELQLQKLQLEKEFQTYSELWKALVNLLSSVIITPTLDRVPKGKSLYEVYKDRFESAVEAFNKANSLFRKHRPFYHDDVSKITGDLLSECRGYINSVARMLKSGSFDDELHDKADELLEKVPKAIDEIEKAIKMRIGLLPGSKKDVGVPIDLEIGSIVKITKGSITFQSNTSNAKPFIGLKMSITEGYLKRNDFGKLETYIKTCVPFESLQCLNEKLGLDSMHLFSESEIISVDSDNPTVFTSSTSHILPQGEMVLDISTWQETPLPMTINVHTQTKASGHLKGKVFQGKFEANLTYHEINRQIGLNGDFQVHLA